MEHIQQTASGGSFVLSDIWNAYKLSQHKY